MMIIGRLRPDRKTKYGTKSGRPKAPGIGADGRRLESSSTRKLGPSSLLEQLPTELLQDIFLFSANLHLPLCSKQMLSALTSDHLKFEITLQILVFQSQLLDEEERSLLLSRRFFTWAFVVRYFQFAQTRVSVTGAQENSPETSDEDSDSDSLAEHSLTRSTRHERNPAVPAPRLQDVDRDLTLLSRNAIEELRRDQIGHLIEMGTLPTPAMDELLQIPSFRGVQGLELPEKLLHGGYDDDKLRLLRFLIAFNCTASRMSSAGVAAEEGTMEAIEQGDEEMLSYFLGAHIGVDPTLEMLREAMSGDNVSIVFQLLHSGRGQLDSLDPQVWRLLETHLRWEKGMKETIRKWLQKGISGPISETHAQYLPRLRDVNINVDGWLREQGS